MKDHSMLRPTRYRAMILALLVLPLAALTGCDDSLTDSDPENVQGVWVGQSDGTTVYLEISSNEFAIYAGTGETCFQQIELEIVNIGGDRFMLSVPGTEFSDEIILRRSGDRLEVRDPTDPNAVAYYDSSNENVSELEVCPRGGVAPDFVCTDLPRIDVGETVTGSLSDTDPTSFYGSYYDLYALQLTASQQVTIDLRSDDVDSFLVVYDEDGGQIDFNDDADGDTYDASVTVALEPGCYAIEATSLFPEETGSYTLSVN